MFYVRFRKKERGETCTQGVCKLWKVRFSRSATVQSHLLPARRGSFTDEQANPEGDGDLPRAHRSQWLSEEGARTPTPPASASSSPKPTFSNNRLVPRTGLRPHTRLIDPEQPSESHAKPAHGVILARRQIHGTHPGPGQGSLQEAGPSVRALWFPSQLQSFCRRTDDANPSHSLLPNKPRTLRPSSSQRF